MIKNISNKLCVKTLSPEFMNSKRAGDVSHTPAYTQLKYLSVSSHV